MKIFAPKHNGINLQDSGNYFMDNIIYFHDLVLCILFFILFLVTWFLYFTLLYFISPNVYRRVSLILSFNFLYILIILNFYYFYYRLIKDQIALRWFNFYINIDFKNLNIKTLYNNIHIFISYVIYELNYNLERAKAIYLIRSEYYINDYILIFLENFIYRSSLTLREFLINKSATYRYYFYSDVKLEFLWTIFPSLILLFLAIPSFGLLFSVEKVSAPEITVKIIGHQWYWEYQYMDYINFKEVIETENYKYLYLNKTEDNYIIESYMIGDDDLSDGQLRLLEVDKKLVLPLNTSIRLLITSDDVLHSWAIPSLGIKVDACPGRLNEIIIKIREHGIYYGQCSELCGWYHGFMPIVIQTLERDDFKFWALSSFLDVKYVKKN